MKNGCPKCEKLPHDKLCDWCELELLGHTAIVALKQYQEKVNDILRRKVKPDEDS